MQSDSDAKNSPALAAVPVDLRETFRQMMLRRMLRSWTGYVRPQSRGGGLWAGLAILLLALNIIVLSYRRNPDVADTTLTVVLTLALLVVLLRAQSVVVRWSLLWLLLAWIALVVLSTVLRHEDRTQFHGSPEERIVLGILLALECLTWLAYFAVHYGYYRWVSNSRVSNESFVERWWNIRWLEGGRGGQYRTMEMRGLLPRPVRHSFFYDGDVHPTSGKPHGLGRWSDDALDGECMVGYWQDGIPVGPFVSTEYGTGFGMRSVRIAFASCSADQWDRVRFVPRHLPLQWGAVSVECSVNGKFFSHLPDAKLLLEPSSSSSSSSPEMAPPVAVLECLQRNTLEALLARNDSAGEPELHPEVCIVRHLGTGWEIPGYHPSVPQQQDELLVLHPPSSNQDINCKIEIEGWQRIANETLSPVNITQPPPPPPPQEEEALVFIHGFNSSLKHVTGLLGQMLTLGGFPAHIKPYVFNWPCGQIATFYQARRSAMSEPTQQALGEFLRILGRRYRRIHMVAHSMGGRVSLSAAHLYPQIFAAKGDLSSALPRLASFTLLNPEACMETFQTRDYPHIYRICDTITLYADTKDGALRSAEIFSGERMLGKRIQHQLEALLYGELMGPVVGVAEQVNGGMALQPLDVRRQQTTADLEHNAPPAETLGFQSLDVDILDTTYLDLNVQNMRHVYFNLNRLMLDDLRDVLCRGQRARERTGRVRAVGGNVYQFLNAPSYVVNA